MRPFDGSMIIEVRYSPSMFATRHAAIGPEQVVVADRRQRSGRFDLLVRIARRRVGFDCRDRRLADRRSFLLGERAPLAQLRRALDRRRRCVGPHALQVRRAIRQSRHAIVAGEGMRCEQRCRTTSGAEARSPFSRKPPSSPAGPLCRNSPRAAANRCNCSDVAPVVKRAHAQELSSCAQKRRSVIDMPAHAIAHFAPDASVSLARWFHAQHASHLSPSRRSVCERSAASLAASPETLDNFRLTDQQGASHELYYLSDMKAVVLLAQGNGCEVSQAAAATLEGLRAKYEPQGVTFLQINSNLPASRDGASRRRSLRRPRIRACRSWSTRRS